MYQLKTPLLLDGSTGKNLIKAGMPAGVCVEKWILDNPDVLIKLQEAYVEAGSNVVMAPTFQANRHSLGEYGFGSCVADFNRRLVAVSKKAVGGRAAVAGNISATGLFVEPFGDTTFDELVDIFREQAFALRDAGVDYIACETFMNLTEARAALLAAKQTGLPVTVTLTVEDSGKTLSGGDVLADLATLAAMGADAVGLNCSTGPEIILKALEGVAKYINVPLIAKPNAGMREDGVEIDPAGFAGYVAKFYEQGIGILGGCCGTTPEHIAAMRSAMDKAVLKESAKADTKAEDAGVREFIAANEKEAFFINESDLEFSHKIACDSDLPDNLLELEGANCAARIKIKSEDDAHEFGMNAYLAKTPVLLLGYEAAGLELALRLYQGRALVDAKSDIEKSELARIAARYGAVII